MGEPSPMWTIENRARYDRSRLRYPSDLTDAEWALVECISRRPSRANKTVNLRRSPTVECTS